MNRNEDIGFLIHKIDNRIKKLAEIEERQRELTAQAEAIKDEIKKDLEEAGEDERSTGNYIVRWKEIISSRFDNKAFKAAMPELYGQYSRETVTRRFSIA